MLQNNLKIYDKDSAGATFGNIFGFTLRLVCWFIILLNYLFKRR